MTEIPEREDGAPWRNFYGRRRGKTLRSHQAELIEHLLKELAPPGIGWDENPERDPIDLNALFPDKHEVWLEIGFGAGEHAIAQAARYCDTGLIACEPFINGVAALLAKIEESGVTNLSVTSADARDVMDVLPAASIQRAFLLYPDPWPKTRHHKRRFVNPEQIEMLARVLAPGAHLRVATDIEDYVRHALEAMDRDGRFEWLAERPDDWRVPWSDWPGTRYEAKALREGRKPHYLTFVRAE
ncbi:MAG: tRNA (guanine(46)-N(7))-methyltransferase TrmB [Pseudomonadota bacterium]